MARRGVITITKPGIVPKGSFNLPGVPQMSDQQRLDMFGIQTITKFASPPPEPRVLGRNWIVPRKI